MTTDPARRLHCSRVDATCLYREHKYESGEWMPPARTYFLRGTACHGARQWALTRYMEDGELPGIEHVCEAAIVSAEARNSEDEERGGGLLPEEMTEAIDEALPIVQADYHLVLPRIAPSIVAVEEEIEAPVAEGVVLTGRFDARGVDPVTGAGLLPDLKTAAKSPGTAAQQAADMSVQLSLYAALHNFAFGNIPRIALQYVWAMKRGPKKETMERDGIEAVEVKHGEQTLVGCARTIPTERTAWDIETALLRVRFRLDADEAGWHPYAAASGAVPECAHCDHRAHPDPDQRCPWMPNQRRA